MNTKPLIYPATRRDEGTVDDYFGTKVADPYRWLEDDTSEETKAWVAAQNAVTFAFLADIPEREAIAERLRALWNYEKFGLPVKRGVRCFYSHNSGLQAQSVLKVAEGSGPGAIESVLLDPNLLSEEGLVSLNSWNPSPDGDLLAYALAEAGSDWVTWRVREVSTGKDLPDTLRWSKFGEAAWLGDGSGFFYVRYAEPTAGSELTGVNRAGWIAFHRLGSAQADDEVVFARSDEPELFLGATTSDDGAWLVLSLQEGTNYENRIWTRDLRVPGSPVLPLLDANDASYVYLGNSGDRFYFRTSRGAPRGRVIAVDRGRPEESAWLEPVPEGKGREVLEFGCLLAGGRLLLHWLRDVASALTIHALDGTLVREVELPGLGSLTGISGRADDEEGFCSYSSYDRPGSILRLDLSTGASSLWRAPRLDYPFEELLVEREFYASKDGTRIPLFIVRRKDLVRDSGNPTILYGYGGFSISMSPYFRLGLLPWFERGGILAVACLRGGGEYGKDWYDSGRLANKQNVFDDFIAAAEHLVAEGWTSTPKLAIEGGSNGGLLVGACLDQRPELFGAAVAEVGVMDMLRFHRFTVGWGWKSDYGSSETREGFDILHAYSPLHNLREGRSYPATLVVTGDHDDRVVPAHSHKFTARLQACQGGKAPVLTRIETDAGHGAGLPLPKVIQSVADTLAFLVKVLGA